MSKPTVSRWFFVGLLLASLVSAIAHAQVVMYEFESADCKYCRSPQMIATLKQLRAEGVDVRPADVAVYRGAFDAVRHPASTNVPQFVVMDNGRVVSRAVGMQSIEVLRNMWASANPARPHAQARAYVCRVLVDDGPSGDGGRITSYGSGVLVAQGLVLTNAHVVRDRKGAIQVNGHQAEILAVDPQLDLCALEVPEQTGIAPVVLADEPPPLETNLIAAGFGPGQYREVSGQVVGYAGAGGSPDFLQVNCQTPVRDGDSGGPLLDGRGRLVGVLFGQRGNLVHGAHCGRLRDFIRGAIAKRRPGAAAQPPRLSSSDLQAIPAKRDCSGSIAAPTYAPTPGPVAYDPPETYEAPIVEVPAVPTSSASIDEAPYCPPGASCPLPPSESTTQPAAADKTLGETFKEAIATWWSPAVKTALVYFGVPTGGATLIAWGSWQAFKILRRRRQRKAATAQAEAGGPAAPPTSSPPAEVVDRVIETPGRTVVRERHHNHVIEVPELTLDRAWSQAIRTYAEHFPGTKNILKAVERLKEQILKGEPPEIGIK